MTKLLLIAGGGALGAVLRYLASGWGQTLTDGPFPVGTLLVNVAGCFLVGALTGLFSGPALVSEPVRLMLLVGFLGGFTTFSTFGFETMQLFMDGQKWLAITNVVASNGLGLAAVWLGYRLAVWMYGVA